MNEYGYAASRIQLETPIHFAKVNESASLRRQSKQLLEYAKQAVEMAIEQGEDIALAWLKSKVEQ